MSPRVLIATPSEYRRSWYLAELARHGFDVTVVTSGVECVELLRATRQDVLVLESSLHWGGADGILTVRNEEADLRSIPVVLISVDGVSIEMYRLARYSVQGFFGRRPSTWDLAATLHAVVRRTPARLSLPTSDFTRQAHVMA